jgi:hypothetical protein
MPKIQIAGYRTPLSLRVHIGGRRSSVIRSESVTSITLVTSGVIRRMYSFRGALNHLSPDVASGGQGYSKYRLTVSQ